MLASVKSAPSPIAGLVWYQGERDAHTGTPDYEKRLTTFIDRRRNLTGNPELAVVVVQLVWTRAEGWDTGMIREAQRRVAAADDHVAIVPAMDLPRGDQPIHLNEAAHDEIGCREGLAMLNIVFQAKDLSHGPHFRRAFPMPGRDDPIVMEFEPKSTSATPPDQSNYDFAGTYIEATIDNNDTGNHFVLHDVKADQSGKIELRAGRKKDDERSKLKPSLSGLQIIHQEASP